MTFEITDLDAQGAIPEEVLNAVQFPEIEAAMNARVTTAEVIVTAGKTLTVTNTLILAGVDGKTLTVNQNLTLTGASGKILTLTTSLTNNGGDGVLAWPGAGATLTVPATGTAVLSGGLAGGQTVTGGTAASENLTLLSTAHATKGKILFGTLDAFDGTSGFWGFGTQSPAASVHVAGNISSAITNNAGGQIRVAAATITDSNTAASGTLARAGAVTFSAPTFDATNATVTHTKAATVIITGNAAAAGNVTITNALTLLITGSSPRALLEATGSGATAFTRTMAGLELTSGTMDATNKYTPALKFGSTDADLTTENPKFGAFIAGRATENYNGDTKGGMGLDFAVTAAAPGTTNVPAVKLSLDATTLTFADAVDIVLNTSTGTKIGTATGQKLGFYNVTPIAQRSGAAQAAVITTASTQTTPWGFATQAQADAIVTLVNELRAWAVAQGFIKGSA